MLVQIYLNSNKSNLKLILNQSQSNTNPIKLISKMFKGNPCSSKIIEKRMQQRILSHHTTALINIRPITSLPPTVHASGPLLNRRKKEMQLQDRFTQIQRENRMLLEKITGIMNKRQNKRQDSQCRVRKQDDNRRVNRSLNEGIRRKQYQSIQIENAKMLKRLQDRKSDYQFDKYKKDWRRTKKIIRNLASFPLIIEEPTFRKKSRFTANNFNPEQVQLQRSLVIDNIKFVVVIKLTLDQLIVLADNKQDKEIKVIEIERNEGLDFVQKECGGKLEGIFELLRYDHEEKAMYLIGRQQHVEELNDLQGDTDVKGDFKDEKKPSQPLVDKDNKRVNPRLSRHSKREVEQEMIGQGQFTDLDF